MSKTYLARVKKPGILHEEGMFGIILNKGELWICADIINYSVLPDWQDKFKSVMRNGRVFIISNDVFDKYFEKGWE